MKKLSLIVLAATLFASCGKTDEYDASGAFESVETIVSTEASGTIMAFNVQEGDNLKAGQYIGYIDTVQLYAHKQQLLAQIASTTSQLPNIPVQVASLQSQLEEAQTNQKRISNLFNQKAATQQQLDDANTQVDVYQRQIAAEQSSLGISSATISKDVGPLQKQIDQINDQLKKSYIINPINGTVLTKYSEDHEVVQPGKALYDIAQTDTLILRAYITGNQLDQVKLGQQIKVRTDLSENQYKYYTGTVYWISSQSEFTPKTIPTKEERADLVYAIKVRVPNTDGLIKIGMYGEVKFTNGK